MKVYFAQLNKMCHYGTYAEKPIPGDCRIIFADDLEQAKVRVQNSLVSNENLGRKHKRMSRFQNCHRKLRGRCSCANN